MLTYEQVSKHLMQVDGKLFWRIDMHRIPAGSPAGCFDAQGYGRVTLFRRQMQSHRVVWLLVHGEWPDGPLDHINGAPGDNRVENLRLCTFSQNAANRRMKSHKLPKGVTLHRCGKFQAVCAHQYLGLFAEAEAAGRAYDLAALAKYGEFAKTNYVEQS